LIRGHCNHKKVLVFFCVWEKDFDSKKRMSSDDIQVMEIDHFLEEQQDVSRLGPPKPFHCDYEHCSTTFATLKGKVTHMARVHKARPVPKEEKDYPCPNCVERFKSKLGLINHVRAKHEGFTVKKRNRDDVCIPCNVEGCRKKFKSMAAYNHHFTAIHTVPSKPPEKVDYVCEFCGRKDFLHKCNCSCHMRYCLENPNRRKREGHKHTPETKKLLSDKARANPYPRKTKHTVLYHGMYLDSSWEVQMAKRFEYLSVLFVRPRIPLNYIGEDGKLHHYFPDFWLPCYGKYVEVKNEYLFRTDGKVKILRKRKNIVWVTSLEQARNFVLSLLTDKPNESLIEDKEKPEMS